MDKHIEPAYQETLDYLYRFVDYSLVRNFRFSPEKFNLGRMVDFMEKLGNPHRHYQVIHVAGTKGKGSTSAMTASILRAAGYRVGFYSSPHLRDFTERFEVNGQKITQAELVDLVAYMKPTIEQVEQVSWFEITTALAFEWFARQRVDLAVVEVGLGGRLDATNVVEPMVSVITALSMDHMSVLGDTIGKIAFEKAGIIKPGRPVVTAPQPDEAGEIIRQVAETRASPLIQVGRDVEYQPLAHSLQGQSLELRAQGGLALRVEIPLLGLHQVENAACAYTVILEARRQGWAVSDEAVRAGFAGVTWPGRFELLHRNPLVIVDSAHNRDSAHRLRQTLDDYLPGMPVVLIFGASEDKDVKGMLEELKPRVSEIIATQSVHPRAMAGGRVVEIAAQVGCPAQATSSVEDAVDLAVKLAGQDKVILAAGSLFIAAAVRDVWHTLLEDLTS